MSVDNIKNICSGLMYKAKTEHFLDNPVQDIEHEANRFVEEYAEEHGLTAHTLSAFRWYFQSEDRLLEDGFIELQCKPDFLRHKGSCIFTVVDVAEVDEARHLNMV